MIEDPQDEASPALLPLEAQVLRVNRLEVVRFLLRLERHHRRHAFPRYKCRTRHLPAGHGLAPSGQEEGTPERAHRPNAGDASCRREERWRTCPAQQDGMTE